MDKTGWRDNIFYVLQSSLGNSLVYGTVLYFCNVFVYLIYDTTLLYCTSHYIIMWRPFDHLEVLLCINVRCWQFQGSTVLQWSYIIAVKCQGSTVPRMYSRYPTKTSLQISPPGRTRLSFPPPRKCGDGEISLRSPLPPPDWSKEMGGVKETIFLKCWISLIIRPVDIGFHTCNSFDLTVFNSIFV